VDDILIIEPSGIEERRQPWKTLEKHFSTLFGELEYARLASASRPLNTAAIGFYLPRDTETIATHGVRLRYFEHPEMFGTKPRIQINPVVFIRKPGSVWLTIDSLTDDLFIPLKEDKLNEHLEEVRRIALNLRASVSAVFAKEPKWISLVEHYSDDESFPLLPGISRTDYSDEYMVVTGDNPHYFRAEPLVENCPFHDWLASKGTNVQSPREYPISARSVQPRAYFPSPGIHHCSHVSVEMVKSSPITDENRSRCGNRSGADNTAFCEIRPFETNLCCQTCVFVDVCEKAEVFVLPCRRPVGN
jgi:hypothetical protein